MNDQVVEKLVFYTLIEENDNTNSYTSVCVSLDTVLSGDLEKDLKLAPVYEAIYDTIDKAVAEYQVLPNPQFEEIIFINNREEWEKEIAKAKKEEDELWESLPEPAPSGTFAENTDATPFEDIK